VVYSTAIVRQRVERGGVVVPDRLVQRDWRLVPFGDIAARGWIEFTLANDDPLNIVDLRESGCLILWCTNCHLTAPQGQLHMCHRST
jgi:hypothetical protein